MGIRRLILLFIFQGFMWQVMAQKLTYTGADILSAYYFENFYHDSLQSIGNAAIREGIDFYDLRVRLGVDAFKSGNYERAARHLERAVDMNPSENYVLNYYWLSLVYCGRLQEANIFLDKHRQISSNVKPAANKLMSVEAEAGVITGVDNGSISDNTIRNPNGNYAQGNFYKGMQYGRLYTEFITDPSNRIHAGFNVFNSTQRSKLEFFQNNIDKNLSTLNYQFNIGMTHVFKHGWLAGAALALYRENFTYPAVVSSIYPPPPNSGIQDTVQISNNNAVSLFVSKRTPYLQTLFTLNTANFDATRSYQAELGATVYPLGNTKLYSFGSVSGIRSSQQNNLAYQFKIGFEPIHFWNIEFNYLGGSLNNYMSQMGFLTLNTFDPLLMSTGADISWSHGKWSICPGYRFQKREGSYFSDGPPQTFETYSYTYTNHLVYLLIKCQL